MKLLMILAAASALTTSAATSNPAQGIHQKPQIKTIKAITAQQSIWGTIEQLIFGTGR